MAKLVEVTDPKELEALWCAYDSVGAPFLHQDLPYAPCYADAAELRAWRSAQSTSRSEPT
jgi:hypothetical protein